MHNYYCLNPIAQIGLDKFKDGYQETKEVNEAEAVLVRSADMHEFEFSSSLQAIARAGAGVNNIPLERAADEGIVVFNTPGANANGVKELVIAGMLMAARDIIGGINWVQEHEEDGNIAAMAEKQKKDFAGFELEGKKLGVIGLGAIGVLVANAATHLGMEVYGYDPFVSVESAWKLSRNIHPSQSADEIYKNCDFISVHVPANKETIGMINKETIGMMKENVVILNYARDLLVNSEDMVDALLAGRVAKYVCDFPTPEICGVKNTIVIPHLGASTEESEDNCAKMAVRQVREYLENGNIINSVNYPNCDMGKVGDNTRITILHKNTPNMIVQFTNVVAEGGVNIENMTNKSRGEYAYTVIDVADKIDVEAVAEKIRGIENVLRVRSI